MGKREEEGVANPFFRSAEIIAPPSLFCPMVSESPIDKRQNRLS